MSLKTKANDNHEVPHCNHKNYNRFFLLPIPVFIQVPVIIQKCSNSMMKNTDKINFKIFP